MNVCGGGGGKVAGDDGGPVGMCFLRGVVLGGLEGVRGEVLGRGAPGFRRGFLVRSRPVVGLVMGRASVWAIDVSVGAFSGLPI